jgi:hypothetical protein
MVAMAAMYSLLIFFWLPRLMYDRQVVDIMLNFVTLK